MPYIVDGNNVMGQTPGWHRDKGKARIELLKQLASFARLRGVRVTVAFDGAPDQKFPEGSAFKGILILYARRGSNADDRIVELIESSKDPRGITVVTSDRLLGLRVRQRGASILRSGEFRKQMESARDSQKLPAAEAEPDAGDLDGWLRYFGAEPDD
jgi:predicted RNA-binding protein with PIN domain